MINTCCNYFIISKNVNRMNNKLGKFKLWSYLKWNEKENFNDSDFASLFGLKVKQGSTDAFSEWFSLYREKNE